MTHRLPHVIPLSNVSFETVVKTLAGDPGFVCMDSRRASGRWNRHSIIAASPEHTFSFSGGFVTVDGHTMIDTPFIALSEFCGMADELPYDPYLTVSGGAIGYVGFEGAKTLRGFEPARGFSRIPQCRFGIYRTIVIHDNLENTMMIVSDTAKNAEILLERLQDATEWTPPEHCETVSDAGRRMIPDDACFKKLAEVAHSWLRSESIDRLHLVRHEERPQSLTSPIDVFLAKHDSHCHFIFSHEQSVSIFDSDDLLLETTGTKPIDELANLLPVETLTGSPLHRAMHYIDGHENVHRQFYGGAFGTIHSRGLAFRTIQGVTSFTDGAVRRSVGADMTADILPEEITRRIDSLLNP